MSGTRILRVMFSRAGRPCHFIGRANMSAEESLSTNQLEGNSPFELRIDQSRGLPESAVKHALETGDMGFLHSFTTGSTVDGPGVRVVAWTAGCLWRCLYCHNPDTWNLMNGMPVTMDRATDELRKYRQGLKVMSGGFTLSGGEPLMQDRFAVKLLTAAKAMGIHTAMETNGYLGERLTDEELEKIDLVLLGIKTWGSENHRQLTGKDISPTLDFARRLAARKRSVWVRFVLVPGLTDDAADLIQIAKFIADMGNVERVEVLPFHQMGRYKWKELDIDYKLEGVEAPTSELTEWACGVFRAEGLNAQ
jgi:pyruvate formate lyase activating enzyme